MVIVGYIIVGFVVVLMAASLLDYMRRVRRARQTRLPISEHLFRVTKAQAATRVVLGQVRQQRITGEKTGVTPGEVIPIARARRA
jgi:hypothetical protein